MEKREKRVILCLAHMSGNEIRYVNEAFETNWVVPLGPNVNAFEDELHAFVISKANSKTVDTNNYPQCINAHNNDPEALWKDSFEELHSKKIVALSSGTAIFL